MKIRKNKYTLFIEQMHYVYFIPLDRKIRTKNGMFHTLVEKSASRQTLLIDKYQDYLRDAYGNLLYSNAKTL